MSKLQDAESDCDFDEPETGPDAIEQHSIPIIAVGEETAGTAHDNSVISTVVREMQEPVSGVIMKQ